MLKSPFPALRILVPSDEDGPRRTLADLHRRYTSFVNARARTTMHLWQGRHGSVAMDEAHPSSTVRYVTLDAVRARLVASAGDGRSPCERTLRRTQHGDTVLCLRRHLQSRRAIQPSA